MYDSSAYVHGLAPARRADQQDVVGAGGRDLEGALGVRLAADVGEVEIVRRGPGGRERGGGGGGGARPARGARGAARAPRAIGRSKAAPSLRRSAGARFTVMRSFGKAKPALRIAVRTRSRLSRPSRSPVAQPPSPGTPAIG